MKFIRSAAAALLAVMVLSSCAAFPPAPDNEQILKAIEESNESESKPLELVYSEMHVPHRFPGRAGAVLWVPDKSIQRNYSIFYDKKKKCFYVKSYATFIRGEDGVYRDEQ
ncbi:MAG TPA: hypothetical protein PLL98_11105 [Bacillota bacterium]|nr:hypothetical protein [Bacillota bacterium]HPL54191.1 hypothetical protein [Bacillota bacterium]